MNPINNELSASLLAVVGDARYITGESIGADYAHDEQPGGVRSYPEAVCEPETTDEISAIVRACAEAGVAVTVRGAGTGMCGGSVPSCGGVVLSMARMNKILSFDEQSMTVRVQPGVSLQELKDYANEQGLNYPVDPGEKTATIGGNVATNAGGPSAVKYGVTRDYLAGATVVLASGEQLSLGGTAGKDNSGYGLLGLIAGSEGTLGVITELTLRLITRPKADVCLILPFMDAESCINAATRIRREGYEPATLEYMDTDIVEFAGKITGNPVFPVEMDGERVGASLLLTLEGKDDDDLDSKMEALAELAEELECLDILVVDTPNLKRDVWAAHDAFHTAVEGAAKKADELNMAVPVGTMAEFVEYVKQLGSAANVGVYAYGHAGDGGLHIYLCGDDAADGALGSISDAAYSKVAELGGSVSSEHGIGVAKSGYVKNALGETGYELMGSIKKAFDPKGILNPGKIV